MAQLTPEEVIAGLVQRGVPLHVAQGVTARLHGESGLNSGINEIAPTVAGSRGGYGLPQWTGPRRTQYEAFALNRGASPDDLNAQLDFLMWENSNTEQGAWGKVLQAKDAVEAAKLFTTHWERPGKPNLDGTIATAQQYAGIQPGNALSQRQSAMPPGANALARPQLQYTNYQNDPNAFAMPTNALSFTPV